MTAPEPTLTDAEFVHAVEHGRVHRFGHREHVRLAYALVTAHGPEQAAQRACRILADLAAAHGEPERFHATLTMGWVRAVAHHMTLAPELDRFDAFIERFPGLLRRDLLEAHFSPQTLWSEAARAAEVAPDRRPIPV